MRLARLSAVALAVVLAAGCLGSPSSSGPDAGDEGAGMPEEGRTARPGDRGDDDGEEEVPRVELGKASGGPTLQGQVPFTVTVPPGGARSVEWELQVTPIGAISLNEVQGPGCTSSGGSATSVGSSTITYGSCGTLAEGDHDFAVVLVHPVASFRASVTGEWSAPVNETSDANSSTNATER